MRMAPRQILFLTLILVTSGTWLYILFPTLNNLYYYQAKEDLTIRVAKFTSTTSDSNATIFVTFNVSNPTRYTGLYIASITFQLLIHNVTYVGDRFNPSTSYDVIGSSGAGPSEPLLLKPFSSQIIAGEIVLTGSSMTRYENYAAEPSPQWHVGGQIALMAREGLLSSSFDVPVGSR